ncbi:MAG: HDOD domain-containing protein [Pirellulales bacterium]
MKRRILFVDDEPSILDGLRRMLRGERNEWDMEFAVGGPAAVELIEQRTFDVVVSDMRMPIVDGAELVERVAAKSPRTVRIILSGQAEEEAILRSIGPAHQFLSKPCTPELLKHTIRRACCLHDRLDNVELNGLLGKIRALPSLPSVFGEILAELNADEPSLIRIGELVACDVGMSTKLLQMINSGYFARAKRISDPRQAAQLLGLSLLRPLILSAGVFSAFPVERGNVFSIDLLLQHAAKVSAAAWRIARAEGASPYVAEDAAFAGLVLDIGRLVYASYFPELTERVLHDSVERDEWLTQTEVAEFGYTHADLGASLLSLWAFPDSIVEAVAYHHTPGECHATGFTPLTAVHVAEFMVNSCRLVPDGVLDPPSPPLDADYIAGLGLSSRIDKWRSLVLDFICEKARS